MVELVVGVGVGMVRARLPSSPTSPMKLRLVACCWIGWACGSCMHIALQQLPSLLACLALIHTLLSQHVCQASKQQHPQLLLLLGCIRCRLVSHDCDVYHG